MKRRRRQIQVGAGLLAVLIGLLIGGCAPQPSAPSADGKPPRTELIVWGQSLGPDSKGLEAVIRVFEARNPDIKVRLLSMGAGSMNPQKLMTAIVGKVPPDVINQDRFTISDWASRGAFLSLNALIQRDKTIDPTTPTPDKYYEAPWSEAVYQGNVYGIPNGADNRVLYYNKRVFRESADALRAAGLDPNRPPRTWSEVLDYSKVLTKRRSDGTLERVGFIPNYGNSWLYMFAFQNNASFLSKDGTTVTLSTPESQEALQFMKDGYKILGGYEEAGKFQSAQRGGENDPFIVGNIAMKIDGDWILSGLARYAPDLEFAAAPAPVPDDRYNRVGRFKNEKDRFITWMGGYAYAIPAGARHADEAWRYIKFVSSPEAYAIDFKAQREWERRRGRVLIPRMLPSRAITEMQRTQFLPADPRFRDALMTHITMADYGRIRPATMVAQRLWDEHVRAIENAATGRMTPKQALDLGQAVVQKELSAFLAADDYPVVDMMIPVYLGVAGIIIALGVMVVIYRRERLGRLGRQEAAWGYLFISPWVLGFLTFTLGPMLASMFFSFTQYNVLSSARWVGGKNYAELASDQQNLLAKSFVNVLYLGGIGVPLGLITGLAIALLLNTGVRGLKYYRTAFYLPSIVPGVATIVLWMFILNSDANRGLINSVWQSTITVWFGTQPPGWLGVEHWAKPSLMVMGLWGAGGGLILWLAGLKGVSTTLYEAASIDGATPRQMFWSVTLPQLTPLVFFSTVMGLIGALQQFEGSYIVTGGANTGPGDSLLTPVYLLFTNGFSYFKMGYASALAWVIFFIVLALTLVQFKLAPRWVHTEVDK